MKLKRASRFGLSLFLSLSIATQAFAHLKDVPPDSGEVVDLPKDAPVDIYDPATQSQLNSLQKLAKYDLVETTMYYHAAYLEARRRMQELQERVGADEFNELLDKNKVVFDIEGYGEVAFTAIEKKPVGRIKHKESGVSFVFIEKSQVEEDSKHATMYSARQHHDAGKDRAREYYDMSNKLRSIQAGRDVVFVWLSDPDEDSRGEVIDKIEQRPRYPVRSAAWWKDYWQATYQKPTGYNWRLGVSAGGAQAMVAAVLGAAITTTAGLAGVGPAAVDHVSISAYAATLGAGVLQGLKTAVPSFSFGTTLGVFARTFRNWRSRGSEMSRFIKNSSVSVGFYSLIKTLTPGGWYQLNFFTTDPAHNFVAGLSIAQFFVNLTVKNLLKEPNYGFSDLEAAERADQDQVKLHYPTVGKNEDGNWRLMLKPAKIPSFSRDANGDWQVTAKEVEVMKRADWNSSFKFYIPMNTVNLVDQIWFTWWMSEFIHGNAEWYMPWISTVGLLASIPISWKLLMNFANKKYPNSPLKKKFEIESRKYLDARVILENGMGKLKKMGKGLKRLAGLESETPAEIAQRQAQIQAIPRHEPAFEGQAYEGINWFRPGKNLDCESRLTGKKAI